MPSDEPRAPEPHVFVPHPGVPDHMCAECGWGPNVPCHVPALADDLAPLRSDPAFDYAALERKMWERVEDAIREHAPTARSLSGQSATVEFTPADPAPLRAAIRSYAFAYRLAKIRPEMDAELIEREVTFLRDLLMVLPASYGKACGLLLAAAGEIYQRRTWLAENAERIERTR